MKQLDRKVTVKLDRGNLVTFGLLLACVCGKRNWVSHKDSFRLDIWYCDKCNRPIVLVGQDGKMYPIKDSVTDRGVDDRV